MRVDLTTLEREFAPLLEVHAVELVALEWFQGPGHGILRVTVDLPDGDPRVQDPSRSVGIDQLSAITRDLSTHLDTIDPIVGAYTLEVGSPGPERPVRKRRDFDRFVGLEARIEARTQVAGAGTPQKSLTGTLRGTVDAGDTEGGFRVRLDVAAKTVEIPAGVIARARTLAIKPAAKEKPGKGPSRRQERLAAREKARSINAAHQAARAGETDKTQPNPANPGPSAGVIDAPRGADKR